MGSIIRSVRLGGIERDIKRVRRKIKRHKPKTIYIGTKAQKRKMRKK